MSSHRIFDDVLRALRRISRATDLHSRHLISCYGVSGPQVMVLRVLGERAEISVKELTSAVHLSQATVTGILDRLEKGGYVSRSRHGADKRRVQLTLTAGGRDVLGLEPPLFGEHFVEEFEKLADWEKTQILSVLQRMVVMMESGAPTVMKPAAGKNRIPQDVPISGRSCGDDGASRD